MQKEPFGKGLIANSGMASWVIGDIHGHLAKLEQLLDNIDYQPNSDQLCFVGDLVNRGPDSLGTLRKVRELCLSNERNVVVLGNHDIYLLAVHYGAQPVPSGLADIMSASDRSELVDWLQSQLLTYLHQASNTLIVHAGVHPTWDLATIQHWAQELATSLRSCGSAAYYRDLFGDQPDAWCRASDAMAKQRFAVNVFTRMRYLRTDGSLDLTTKASGAHHPSAGLVAWYKFKSNAWGGMHIVFGHWAALAGDSGDANCINIDSGCAWGGALTAYNLGDGARTLAP